MKLRRARFLFSARRLESCRAMFHQPWQALWQLAFLTRRQVRVTLQNGQALVFSRRGRDHLFWDWYLDHSGDALEFTADNEILLHHQGANLLLRPGTSDFFWFREIFIRDAYGLKNLPAQLGTVMDLGANVGLFACALRSRAERIISVEPDQANYLQARKNLDHNGGHAADLLRYALAGRAGDELALPLSHNTGLNSLYTRWVEKGGTSAQEKVPTITLTDLLARSGTEEIDLLRSHLQGAEFDVFQATPFPVLRRIRRLLLEIRIDPEHPRSALASLISHLERAGFPGAPEHVRVRGARETYLLHAQRQRRPTFACRG